MSNTYTPTEWKDGDVITAERMNKIEQGVGDATEAASSGGNVEIVTVESSDRTTYTADKTYTQLLEASRQGKVCIARVYNHQYGDNYQNIPLMVDDNYHNAQGARYYVNDTGTYVDIYKFEVTITDSDASFVEMEYKVDKH